jgi:hypothetical protein
MRSEEGRASSAGVDGRWRKSRLTPSAPNASEMGPPLKHGVRMFEHLVDLVSGQVVGATFDLGDHRTEELDLLQERVVLDLGLSAPRVVAAEPSCAHIRECFAPRSLSACEPASLLPPGGEGR